MMYCFSVVFDDKLYRLHDSRDGGGGDSRNCLASDLLKQARHSWPPKQTVLLSWRPAY